MFRIVLYFETGRMTPFYNLFMERPSYLPLVLLLGRQVGHPACKKTERWGGGLVICLGRGADLHMARLMPLPLTVPCFSKIQIGFTFLVLGHPGSPGQRVVKWVLDRVLSHWVHFTVYRFICVYLCVFCAFVFLTAYMFYYRQHSGVDLVGLKPSP